MYPKLSESETYFVIDGQNVFNKTFISALKFHSPGLAPVQDSSGWYHINTNGQAIYHERYDRVFGYYFDKAAVVDDNIWYHIDTIGKRVYANNYAWTGNYQENNCTVRDFHNNYFHVDEKGNRLYKENYRYAGDFKDGYACVRLNNGMFKHIDKQGDDLNGILFEDLGVFHKSFATAKDKNGWFHINKNGVGLYQERYLSVEPFYNGYSLVETYEKKKIIINEKGNKILDI